MACAPLDRMKTEAQFWAKVSRVDGDGCWLWMGGRSGAYGMCRWRGETRRAHRVSWMLATGKDVADNVCHKCANPLCVRPDHLYDGSPTDNALDRARGPRVRARVVLTRFRIGTP